METQTTGPLRILILTVSHGAAHRRASQALRQALLGFNPDLVVQVEDALDHCSGWFRAYYDSYEIPLKYWPALWGWIETIQHRSASTGPGWLYRRGAQPLFRFIHSFDPDVVVATEVGVCEVAALIKRETKARFGLVGLELMDFNKAWIQPEVDLYLTTHTDLAAELASAGARGERIVTCGQPIDPAFASVPGREAARARLGLEPNVPLVLVLFGGAGLGRPLEILREVRTIRQPLQVVFITGRNVRLEQRIRESCRDLPGCRALGWVDNMHEWMAAADLLVSKPGGNTLAEAFTCGLPMLVFDPLPGNERRTCRWIEKWEAGRWVKHPHDLAPTIERLLSDRDELSHLRDRARALARPRAAHHAAQTILQRFGGLNGVRPRASAAGPYRSRLTVIVSLGVLAATLQLGLLGQVPSSQRAETITIDAQAPSHPFPHYWEKMFGSGRAILSLRDSYRQDVREVKAATGFEYIRFHGIFDDEVGVYDEDQAGNAVYNFSYVDQIYDGLLANGVRPFVELSFMPKKLASNLTPHPFWYKPYPCPPRDWDRWADMIEHFALHLVDRYGIDEVSHWYFEVWNEPNIDFWTGVPKEETYDRLYDVTARALKHVSSRLRVGGPATAQAAWVDRFIRHCVEAKVPVDFVSTHVYANDTAHDVFGTTESIPRDRMVYLAVKKVHDQVKASPRPDLPLIFSEYNASYLNEVQVTDSPFMGPWLANTIRQCDGLLDALAYWAFSDVFEETGAVKRPFYGGYGLMAAGNIPKASFNAFKLLHLLGGERLEVESDAALATRRADGSLAVGVWNYVPPGGQGAPRSFTLSLKGLSGPAQARIHVVDRDHGSSLTAWEAMGKPDFPTRERQEKLRDAARLPPPKLESIAAGDPATIRIELEPQALALIEITKQ